MGTRLGGPKALLRWPYDGWANQPLAAVHARLMLRAGCARVLIVTRAAIARVLEPELPAGARALVSYQPDQLGPAGSLRVAARQLGSGDQRAFVTPVDALPPRPYLYAALARALAAGDLAARPRYGVRRGHPVLLKQPLLRPFISGPQVNLRQVLRAQRAHCVDVPVLDPNVLRDLDTPGHWQQLARRQRCQPAPELSFIAAALPDDRTPG